MSLTAGIVGLPNVGKSTLFNAITNQKILAANYPFATIDPNVGVVTVPDKRIEFLSKLYQPKKTIPATFEFTDIAGLVKGASLGEGLGNKFLSHIREVDAICEVVRCFDDSNITHVEGKVDPIRDVEIIDVELTLSDLEIIDNRLNKISKKAKQHKEKDTLLEIEVLTKIKNNLTKGVLPRNMNFSSEELKIIKVFNLLTLKPIIFIANISENEIGQENTYVAQLKEHALQENAEVVVISAKIESELSELEEEEKQIFLNDLGMKESGLDKLIQKSYFLLGLATFFTAGKDEVKAWTFKQGMTAPQCAGIIHTDFQKGFIKAEVISYKDLYNYKSELKVKESGKLRIEGKEYLMKDGEICLFRFNV